MILSNHHAGVEVHYKHFILLIDFERASIVSFCHITPALASTDDTCLIRPNTVRKAPASWKFVLAAPRHSVEVGDVDSSTIYHGLFATLRDHHGRVSWSCTDTGTLGRFLTWSLTRRLTHRGMFARLIAWRGTWRRARAHRGQFARLMAGRGTQRWRRAGRSARERA
jgi:hypothetical protein